HDRYEGTDIPKNFSSRVRLLDAANNVDREFLIWMNHPLRYNGETFYQSSFKPGDHTTVLQVVKNPGWLIPYISCAMVGLGLLIHFSINLIAFLRRTRQKERVELPGFKLALGVTTFCILYLLGAARPAQWPGGYDLNRF